MMKKLSVEQKGPEITDPRFRLLAPQNIKSFYIHQDAVYEGDEDSVAGPFTSIESIGQLKGIDNNNLLQLSSQSSERIERINLSSIVKDRESLLASTSFTNYEIRRVIEDETVIKQRSVVDRKLLTQPLSRAPEELIFRAKEARVMFDD
jgi:hypothetical protein